jgi:SAM-dependent methyltransferase
MEYDENALQTVRETRFLIDQFDRWLFAEYEPFLGQRILEIGCGLGNQIRFLLDRELVIGLDNCPETVSEVQQLFAEAFNVQFTCLSITDPEVIDLEAINIDTIISFNCLEHIEDDELAIRHCSTILQPKGKFILILPAHKWLYGSMDRSIGHYRRYNKETLSRKLEQNGFNVIKQKYVNLIGAMGWYLNGRILGRRVPPTTQLRLANKIFPITKKIEDYLDSPIGISLLTVATVQT